MRDLAGMFKALGDETRLEILALLVQFDELCVCRFEEVLGITQSKASRHLRYLVNAGLLTDRREGVWVHYRLSPDLTEERAALVEALPDILGEARLAEARDRLGAADGISSEDGVGVCGPSATR